MVGLEGRLKNLLVFASLNAGCPSPNKSDTVSQKDTDSVIETGDTDDSVGNKPYFIENPIPATAYIDQQFSFNIADYVVQDDNGGDLSCRVTAPVNISQNIDESCYFSWTPSATDFGQRYDISLEIEDNYGINNAVLEVDVDSAGSLNTAPVITTTSLSNAITQTPYTAMIDAFDTEGDALTYSLVDCPSWLSMNGTTLSGTPSSRGTETVTIEVSDGELNSVQSYSLNIDALASLDMEVIDGDSGDGVDNSCNVPVTLTNTSSGYAETVTAVGGYATFNLDETGLYNISVPSTNTGSNCYGGVSLDEWIDVAAGTNSGWVTLIPETYQDEVISVVGSQITTYRDGSAWTCDSVTDLVKYMSAVDSYSSSSASVEGWDSNIRDGTDDLEVEDFNGYTYTGIDYDSALADAVGWWQGSLAPSISIVPSGYGGDIYFTGTGNWQTDVNTDSSTGVITDIEIMYGGVGTYEGAVSTMVHEIGHSFFTHTNIDGFIMHQSFAGHATEPHELELLIARIYNNIGPESTSGGRVDLYNGYSE